MEDAAQDKLVSDLLGTVVRPPSVRVSGSFKSTVSGRFTPRSSSSFKRSQFVRTASRETRPAVAQASWYRRFSSRRLFPWLIVIALWSYIGFHVQSRWAHNEGKAGLTLLDTHVEMDQELKSRASRLQNVEENNFAAQKYHNVSNRFPGDFLESGTGLSDIQKSEIQSSHSTSKNWTENRLWQGRTPARMSDHEVANGTASQPVLEEGQREVILEMSNNATYKGYSPNFSWNFPAVGVVNDSMGKLVGPFDEIERRVLGSMAREVWSSYETNFFFAQFVRGKSFLVVLHELSLTGAPLAMMELASEIHRCGGKVSAVALSRGGGLLRELLMRGIKVLKDKGRLSFRAAAKADVVVAGSAVCASWIEQYLTYNKKGSGRLAWWIMENRREYFDRSKHILSDANVLIFLSEIQSQQWQIWSRIENIALPDKIEVLPLSVNDELSFKAGLQESYGISSEKRRNLRDQVRKKLGLQPTDMLMMTISSINPGKGQLMLLKAALMAIEAAGKLHSGDLENSYDPVEITNEWDGSTRRVNGGQEKRFQSLKLLIGSVGSKSNKVWYVWQMLDLISKHPQLVKAVMWTPATVHVAPLYSAADVYVMNSQGIGETFGRVTIEAMAFGLLILGTDAGGTREIVQNNVTGFLHPVGSPGVLVLAQHINYLLSNRSLLEGMGQKGREMVKKMYLKGIMYEKLAKILKNCLDKDFSK